MLDATDNVATRYLLNDACVLADKPLVSGSALRFEGQVRDKGNTVMCLRIGTPQNNKFSIWNKWKIYYF